MDEASVDVTSNLVDLRGFTLAELDSYPTAVFAPSLPHLLRQIDHPTRSIGGHNS